MKKTLFFYFVFSGFLIIFAACACGQQYKNIPDMLVDQLSSSDGATRYTVLLLLSNTVLNDHILKKVMIYTDEEKNPVLKLCGYYVLARRSQENKYIEAFIDHYPEGDSQRQIMLLHRQGFYISDITAFSPLRDYLASLAKFNDKALEKLISGYNASDGADREELNQQIAGVYAFKPQLVKSIVARYQIDIRQILE